MSVPQQASHCQEHLPQKVFSQNITAAINTLNESVLEGLKIVQDTNFVGGITHKFDDKSVEILRKRILRSPELIEYCAPIKNAHNIYVNQFGAYMAKRPGGKFTRPHLGLDIFGSSPSTKKPANPIHVRAPLDGVVIAHKCARKTDNVIENKVVMLGVDGRIYSFGHLARPEDYAQKADMPKVGTILHKEDLIGFVGRTGETELWHTHFMIMTEENLQKQLSNPLWLKYSLKTKYCPLLGQSNPLDSAEVGYIANILQEYKGAEKIKRTISIEEFDELYNCNK